MTIVDRPEYQTKVLYKVRTQSTIQQVATERECAPFFVDLVTLSTHEQQHLIDTGLVTQVSAGVDGEEEELHDDDNNCVTNDHDSQQHQQKQFDVCLLKERHKSYLQSIFERKLRPSFVSLDASRTWMIYWCLHGLDLMQTAEAGEIIIINDGDDLQEESIVDTIRSCFTKCTVTVDTADPESSSSSSNDNNNIPAGGFGGGPGQLAHAATTYAAVSALCILAPNCPSALILLQDIRPLLYNWMVSLHDEETGSFRMQDDGEIDVRATYCIMAVAKLLNLFTSRLMEKSVDFIQQCQTFEGGFGGEPFAEAHGGYTFCAVAALQLLGGWSRVDLSALAGWLSRRQLAFEGGFSGRSNKLVDGCYSFWQGGAMAIVSQQLQHQQEEPTMDAADEDPWLSGNYGSTTHALFDAAMLERYILLCGQDINGGLRDKPSKPRDFYHSCYCLSGLSVARYYGAGPHFGRAPGLAQTHPVYNIRMEHVQFVLDHFASYSDNNNNSQK